MRFTALLIAMLMLVFMSCTTESTSVNVRCNIQVEPIEANAIRGSMLTVNAYPLTDTFDTHIQINQTTVDASTIEKETCSDCDACRSEYGCTDCAYCPACEVTCDECQHLLTFTIPEELPSSDEYWLTLFNSLGSSEAVYLSIEEN